MYMIDMDCHPPFDVAEIDYIGKVNYKDLWKRLAKIAHYINLWRENQYDS